MQAQISPESDPNGLSDQAAEKVNELQSERSQSPVQVPPVLHTAPSVGEQAEGLETLVNESASEEREAPADHPLV